MWLRVQSAPTVLLFFIHEQVFSTSGGSFYHWGTFYQWVTFHLWGTFHHLGTFLQFLSISEMLAEKRIAPLNSSIEDGSKSLTMLGSILAIPWSCKNNSNNGGADWTIGGSGCIPCIPCIPWAIFEGQKYPMHPMLLYQNKFLRKIFAYVLLIFPKI